MEEGIPIRLSNPHSLFKINCLVIFKTVPGLVHWETIFAERIKRASTLEINVATIVSQCHISTYEGIFKTKTPSTCVWSVISGKETNWLVVHWLHVVNWLQYEGNMSEASSKRPAAK